MIAAPSPLPSPWLLPDIVGMIHSIYFKMNHYVIPTLRDLTSKVKRSRENITGKSEQKPIDLPELPLKSLADFDIFDQALNVQSNYDYYVSQLMINSFEYIHFKNPRMYFLFFSLIGLLRTKARRTRRD